MGDSEGGALQAALGASATLDDHEGKMTFRAGPMDGPCNLPLSGACLAAQEDRISEGGHSEDAPTDALDRIARTHETRPSILGGAYGARLKELLGQGQRVHAIQFKKGCGGEGQAFANEGDRSPMARLVRRKGTQSPRSKPRKEKRLLRIGTQVASLKLDPVIH